MKLLLAILLLFAPAAAKAAPPPPIEVTAKVLELPRNVPHCGIFAWRAVVRYQVISVERGKLDRKDILVVELCPEFRKLGETRKLRLRPATAKDSFIDDFKTRLGPRYVHRDP